MDKRANRKDVEIKRRNSKSRRYKREKKEELDEEA